MPVPGTRNDENRAETSNFDRLEPERLKRYLVRRLQNLGFDVSIAQKRPDGPAA
jgi:hypothetical protein